MFIFSLLYSFFSNFFLAGYITEKESFPKPLTAQEEEIYLKRFRENADENARNILIERNMRLVAHIVKKYSQTTAAETEDLISVGTIGLIKAIDSFDETKKIRLATYASRCIANEILMVLRANKNRKGEISLQNPIGTDQDGNAISLLNVIGFDDDDIADNVYLKSRAEKLRRAMNACLSSREREILHKRFGFDDTDPLPQREIAKKLNISRSYVSRIEKKAIQKLRDYLSKNNF